MTYTHKFYDFENAERISKNIEDSWDKKLKWKDMDHETRTVRNDIGFVKNVWDTYKMPDGMKKEETLVGVLQRDFSNIRACKVCRPLGDFKDFDNATRREVYESLIEQFTKTRIDARGNKLSYLEALYPYAKDLADKYGWGSYGEWFSKSNKMFIQGLSIMFYRSAIGIYLESYINHKLENKFNNSKEFVYKVAPSEMESKDVDGIIYRRDNGAVVVNVSIKTLGAFTNESIFNNWRKPVDKGGKGKTLPDIYIGITNEEYGDGIKTDMRITTINVDMTLKELLFASRQESVSLAA